MLSFLLRLSFALFLLGLAFLWSWHSTESTISVTNVPSSSDSRPVATLAGSYLAARHANIHSDSRAASVYLSEALSYAPQDKELTTQAVRNLLMAGNLDRAVKLAREKTAIEVKSPIIHMTLFIDEAREGNWELASKHMKNIRAFGLQAITLPYLQAWTELATNGKAGTPKSALQLKQSFYNSFQNYQNALLADVSGDKKAANHAFKAMLMDMHSLPERLVVSAVQFHLREGNTKRAKEIYDAYLREHASDLSLQAVTTLEALNQLKEGEFTVRTAQEGVAEVMLIMASMLHAELVDREALVYAQMALFMRPDLADGHFLVGEIYEDMSQKELAIESYSKIPETHPFYRRAALRHALLLDEPAQTEQAIGMLRQLAQTLPKPSDVYMTLADLLRGQEKYHAAAEAYSQAIEMLGPIKPHHWPLFYTRGISYERCGQWEKAESDLLRALSLEPDQPDVKNYLGYSWLLMGKNVEKATFMLEQASQSRPDDGHIIDSLAWAYYLSGDYQKALMFIEQAVEIMPQDATVNDHYGDILWRSGRRTEARYQWERALAFKPEPKDKAAIEQKLVLGLPATANIVPQSTSGSTAATHSSAAHP